MNRRIHLALLLSITPFAATADPILYGLEFQAAEGPNGIGSFVWNDDTEEISLLRWFFPALGPNGLGGITEIDAEDGAYVFALLTNDVEFFADNFGQPGGFIFFRGFRLLGFPNDTAGLCAGAFTDSCRQAPNTGSAAYMFRNDDTFFSGNLRAFQIFPVPEPGTLILMGFGLFGISMARRKKV